jgi:hypothetical protein
VSKKLLKIIKDKKFLHYFILTIILSLAAYLRFSYLNWDQGLTLHPDERNIVVAVSHLNWPKEINPEFYAYNGFPLFLIDINSQILANLTKNSSYLTDWGKINLIARFHSALFSSLSVCLFYLISKLVFKKKTALIAAFLATTTVTFIQHAHYGVTESLLVLELLLLAWTSIKFLKTKKQKFFLLMALILGISIGTKSSALAFGLIPLTSILIIYKLKLETLVKLFIFLILTSLVFFIASPNTIIHFDKFLASMKYEGAVVNGKQEVFYTMQFINTTPYLFQIKNLVYLSSPIIIFTTGYGLYLLLKNRKQYLVLWPFFIYSLIYFIYIGSWYAKFNRYLMPFIPAVILLASLALDRLKNHRLYKLLLIALLLTNFIWALAFLQIFQKEHTRITASHWIEKNIAEQNTILLEEWDERLPSKTNSNIAYQHQTLKLYQADTIQKFETVAGQLAEGDYLIIASRRLYKSIPRSPKHPYTKQYYQLLFAEELGYRQVAQFSSYPNFLGIEIKDNGVEETFQVFDHPTIIIFKNYEQLSSEEIFKKIFKK